MESLFDKHKRTNNNVTGGHSFMHGCFSIYKQYPTTALGRILFSSVVMVLGFRPGVPGLDPAQTLYSCHGFCSFVFLLRRLFVRKNTVSICVNLCADGAGCHDRKLLILAAFPIVKESLYPRIHAVAKMSLTMYQRTRFWTSPNSKYLQTEN